MAGSVLRVTLEGEGNLPGYQAINQALGGRDAGVRFTEMRSEALPQPSLAWRLCIVHKCLCSRHVEDQARATCSLHVECGGHVAAAGPARQADGWTCTGG